MKMEKLIELLNEFEKEVYAEEHKHIDFPDGTFTEGDCWFEGDGSLLGEEDGLNWSGSDYRCYNSDLVIISKSYGFIKRLVENDKIDKEKIIRAETMHLKDVNENYLLMMLAIQEQPIEVLVSILK